MTPSRAARSLLAGRLILPGQGYTPVHGYPDLSLADATVLRATAGTVLYLALIALLSLGIATAVRDVATAIRTVLSLLYLFPVLGLAVTCPGRHRHRQQIAPIAAGLEIQASTGLSHLPISPWAGLGVLAAWPPQPPGRRPPAPVPRRVNPRLTIAEQP